MTRKSARDGRKDEDPESPPKTWPAHEAVIDRPFALGIYPVTREEFGVFVRETHRVVEKGCHVQRNGVWILDPASDWRHPGFAQTPRDPVTCVSWNDAQDYVGWLNRQITDSAGSGSIAGSYRLPMWEEMEYAAAAGTRTPYYWGEQPQRDNANYGREECTPCGPKREGADHWLYTSPVGSFPPNLFGLYDMAGNVWQWARKQRCRAADPDVPTLPSCPSQPLHGGSWLTVPEYLQSTQFSSADIRHRNHQFGFRVARTLDR